MTLPRQVIAGRSYMVTRRCAQRQFLMRPDDETTNGFLYCLGYAAAKFGIEVLFTVGMSNHHHTGIRDPEGRYPEFLACFHQLFAKSQNVLRKRGENFWASEQTSVVELGSGEDVLEKLGYALGNPVKDHLVERAEEWPGASSYRATLENREIVARRPKHYFRREGEMPATVSLRFVRPKEYEGISEDAWRGLVVQRVARVEEKARLERKKESRPVLGAKAVLRQAWTAKPKTVEPSGGLRPKVAAKNKWRRIEMLVKNLAFVEAYREARNAFAAGFVRVVFPRGTYWLRRFADAVCEDVPFLEVELLLAIG